MFFAITNKTSFLSDHINKMKNLLNNFVFPNTKTNGMRTYFGLRGLP